MYAWIWRHLPGPTPVRVAIALALTAGVVAALFLVVFPWAQPLLPFSDVTVEGAADVTVEGAADVTVEGAGALSGTVGPGGRLT